MPLRTCKHKDGHTSTMFITNVHPDGTEFLPEETVIPRNAETELAYRMIEHWLEVLALRDAEEAAKKSDSNQSK